MVSKIGFSNIQYRTLVDGQQVTVAAKFVSTDVHYPNTKGVHRMNITRTI